MKLQKSTNAEKLAHGRWYDDACGTAFGLELLGERWSLLIVRELLFGPRRFADLRTSLPGLSAKVLTERLTTLEATGVLRRLEVRDPAPAKLFELTPWGRQAEIVIQELGRWAAMSPDHDPTLPLSPAAMMASLRTMLDRQNALGLELKVGFMVAGEAFAAQIEECEMLVVRGYAKTADLRFEAPDGPALAAVVYGGTAPPDVGVLVTGDPALVERVLSLFVLPQNGAPSAG